MNHESNKSNESFFRVIRAIRVRITTASSQTFFIRKIRKIRGSKIPWFKNKTRIACQKRIRVIREIRVQENVVSPVFYPSFRTLYFCGKQKAKSWTSPQ